MLALLATSTCTVKRTTISGGERDPSTAATVYSGLACTPPAMADVSRLGAYQQEGLIQSVAMAMETFVNGSYDIRPNDIAQVDGVTYLVVAVAAWPSAAATHVTLERVLQ